MLPPLQTTRTKTVLHDPDHTDMEPESKVQNRIPIRAVWEGTGLRALSIGGRLRIPDSAVAIAILVSFTAMYILLRSRDYLAVDGAVRCLYVYWHRLPITAGNNHLLYYVNSYLWTNLLRALGITPPSPPDYLRQFH